MNKISIIIPVGNDSRICQCLQSIEQQLSIDGLEVILINNNCDQRVKKIIDQYVDRIPLVSIDSSSDNIGLLRNLAIKNASSDIFYFVDSDCILRKDAISNAIMSGMMNDVTRGYIEFQGTSRIAQLDALLRQQRYASDLYFAYCPNLVVRRNVFENIGLFNENFKYGSDGEFAKRLRERGINCSYNAEMSIIHRSPELNSEIIKRWVQYGEGRRRRFKYSTLPEKIKGLFTPILFDLSEGVGYNVVVGLCLASRWYGWIKSSLIENDR
ncbi:MAG: glycosyltransferase [Nanoarchaeota archaeon]